MKMSWYYACLLLLFLFRTNGKKGHLDENGFRHCYGNLFQRWHSESYLIIAMFKVPSQQIRGILTTTFSKIPYNSLFYWHESTCVLNFHQDFSKRYWNENRWRYAKHALGRTLDQNRNHVSVILCVSFPHKPSSS